MTAKSFNAEAIYPWRVIEVSEVTSLLERLRDYIGKLVVVAPIPGTLRDEGVLKEVFSDGFVIIRRAKKGEGLPVIYNLRNVVLVYPRED